MIFRSLCQIVLGWMYHTIYRAQCYWTWKREGAFIAAAAIFSIGLIDTVRSGPTPPLVRNAPSLAVAAAPVTASPTAPVMEEQPLEVLPVGTAEDPPVATGSIPSSGPDPLTPLPDATSAEMPIVPDEPPAGLDLHAEDAIGAKIVSEKLYTEPVVPVSIEMPKSTLIPAPELAEPDAEAALTAVPASPPARPKKNAGAALSSKAKAPPPAAKPKPVSQGKTPPRAKLPPQAQAQPQNRPRLASIFAPNTRPNTRIAATKPKSFYLLRDAGNH